MDSMLAALSNRIREFLESQDPSLVLDPAALEEAARLREAVRPPDGDLRSVPVDVITVLAYLHLARYQVLPDGQDQERPEHCAQSLQAAHGPSSRTESPLIFAKVSRLPCTRRVTTRNDS